MESEVCRVLVLGGTNFMGRGLLFDLAEVPRVRVACINRGNSYWGNKHLELQKSGKFKFFLADRKNHAQFMEALHSSMEWSLSITSAGSPESMCWDLVIDFSAYTSSDMDPILNSLQGRCSLYVYISTDSVYEVCDPARWYGRAVKEEDSVRCQDPKLQAKRSSLDAYGEGKMQIEERLLDAQQNPSIPFLCLRLPDVIGPYDVSDRFWGYLMWIISGYPLHVQRNTLENKLSFIFSGDVVKYLLQLVHSSKAQLALLRNQILNICIPEAITLFELLVLMKKALNMLPQVQHDHSQVVIPQALLGKIELHESGLSWLHTDHLDRLGRFMYPSVTCGPIDCSKALQHPTLPWKSSSWSEIIQQTTEFFVLKGPSFDSEYADVTKLLNEIIEDYYLS